ncbi:methionine import ATP-binding protein MetN [Aliidongia dinghuensis]|uniref:Cell division ATP-binding protein FtsE n=1 Tax=Aliidongia dinghuensis TaxID=1867774 RepID=A0A8J2YUD3_9PROT|nr:methionine ABC transporter ATP-binding protein [Aliidongia dinghuensis]GGF16393.1 methionine import ATP-binding protein MetN [Aliidongia dinghuensis]
MANGGAIQLEALGKRFLGPSGEVSALDDVSLDIAEGEIFGVIGRSGAGKSTLLRAINLLERPDRGRVIVGGTDLTALSAEALRHERRGIGMIFQHFNLLARRSVFDNVALPLELAGLPKSEIRARVTPLLELVGLADKAGQVPAKLSGGQKQRVGIARALAAEPKILLSDEATSALDPQTTRSILTLLKDINQRLGLTIVLITHEMSVVREICDRVAVMEQGRIVELGSTFDVLTRPAHPLAREIARGLEPELKLDQLFGERFSTLPVTQSMPGGSTILRITFTGPNAEAPVIADLVRRFNVDLNILSGTIDYIQGRPYGVMKVEVTGAVEAVLAYLKSLELGVEVLGHVRSALRTAL